jgi:hypothetical protein
MINMGIGELGSSNTCYLRKFRWQISILNRNGLTFDILPPSKAALPSVSFKEMDFQHLTETVYLPGKPEFKPLNVSLYGIKRRVNPVSNWLKEIYNPGLGIHSYPNESSFIKEINLNMLSPGGDIIDTWVYEDCWLQHVEFGDLDMSDSQVVTIDLSIRYSRGYLID